MQSVTLEAGSTPAALPYRAHAFGLRWAADTPLSLLPPAPDDGRPPDVVVERVDAPPPRTGAAPVNAGAVFPDGIRLIADGATCDMIDGTRVLWAAPRGQGLPIRFYGTVTALLLAWRGGVPLHGSAVEMDGRAILICGPGGAGKSTLAAALIAHGGRLISDDLSLLATTGPGETPLLWPGRTSIRLVDPAAPDPADKKLIRPAMTDVTRPIPLTTLLLLRGTPIAPGNADRVAALRRQLFRPAWMKAMPRHDERLATILNAAPRLTVGTLPRASEATGLSVEARVEAALAMMARAQ